ncbi:Peroxisome biogenesis protein 22 [Raphanus sativus]|uniref:Peroxisome biogenesis protein 22-like n=1 Tax=Raphanus sativus TaxID=3726 RepID=A0A6J0JFH2_RAPSA|nr:peroxisome biogenesis protein 22-like [Raphanus sativus]KAJ4868704.1 Peroxisome biogenesis protein 22 [Raphanus sativus]
MAESSSPTEEIGRLIKRLSGYVAFKMSGLFSTPIRNLDSRSIGAIAGLAIAVIFTWRAIRRQPEIRRPKRRLQSDHETSTAPSPDVSSSPHEDVVDQFFQPGKPTLGQIVRQRLSEGRKVTCRLLGVILEESSPEELQKQATVRSSVVEVLLEITKCCDLYLMERVLDDQSEAKVLQALETAGVFTSGGLVKDKVLFCSTEIGRTSFVRQLEPDWHIDTNPEISTQLARFIKFQLHVSAAKPERTAPNVFTSQSIEEFFGCA